jgi:prepilin-type N-terminal cleavage/methylation domain-containing protein
MSSRCHHIRHFTLLEIIVALSILAVISLIVGLTLRASASTWMKTSQLAAKQEWRKNIDQIVNNSFKNAVFFTWRNEKLADIIIFSGKPSSVLLTYLHRINTNDSSGIRFIQLLKEDDKLIAKYRDTPILPWEETNDIGVNREIILEKIKNVSFLYADISIEDNSVKFVDNWDTRKNYIPKGIQITVEFENGDKESWFRRTAGSGYLQQKVLR